MAVLRDYEDKMKNLTSAIAFFSAAIIATAQSPQTKTATPTPAPASGDPLLSSNCSTFRWVPNGAHEHGAIEVPVELNGQTYWFQLDTGSNSTMLYGDEAEKKHWAAQGSHLFRAKSLKVGGVEFPAVVLLERKDMPSGSGTLGLDVLLNHLVLIDYPNERFCIFDPLTFPKALGNPVTMSPASLVRGKLLLSVQIGGEQRNDFFFDSGSNDFPIMVEHSLWTKLTGRSGVTDAQTRVEGTQWGKNKVWPGAQALLPISVVGLPLKEPLVFYEEDGFFSKNFAAAGLIGNAAFSDSILFLDLTPLMRVGTFRPWTKTQ